MKKIKKIKNSTYLSTAPEELFNWFLDQIPNTRNEELPTLWAGCVYLAKFNEITEMNLSLTVKDRKADRLNPILRHQKACFDSWLSVARRFGLTRMDTPKRSPKTQTKNKVPPLEYDPVNGKPLEPRIALRGGPGVHSMQQAEYRKALDRWEAEN